jgi:hypothetical protein
VSVARETLNEGGRLNLLVQTSLDQHLLILKISCFNEEVNRTEPSSAGFNDICAKRHLHERHYCEVREKDTKLSEGEKPLS